MTRRRKAGSVEGVDKHAHLLEQKILRLGGAQSVNASGQRLHELIGLAAAILD
jgi:hypothetical protein